jgi:hypothetical protein
VISNDVRDLSLLLFSKETKVIKPDGAQAHPTKLCDFACLQHAQDRLCGRLPNSIALLPRYALAVKCSLLDLVTQFLRDLSRYPRVRDLVNRNFPTSKLAEQLQ